MNDRVAIKIKMRRKRFFAYFIHSEKNRKIAVHRDYLKKIRDFAIFRNSRFRAPPTFLVNETENSIDLVSVFMFSPGRCRQRNFTRINRFLKATMEWENVNFFPKKYRNLHGCKMFCDDETIIFGYKFEPFNSFREKTNIDLDIPDAKFEVFPRMHDLEVLRFTVCRNDTVVEGTAVKAMVVPPGELLTPLEKFFQPFDFESWILVFAVFLAILLLDMTSHVLCHKTAKCIIFGENVGSPSMNFLEIFLCGGQAKEPRMNSARIFFVLMLFYAFIVRTGFQSLSYRMLQLDPRKVSAVKASEEQLKVHGYRLLMREYSDSNFEDVS